MGWLKQINIGGELLGVLSLCDNGIVTIKDTSSN